MKLKNLSDSGYLQIKKSLLLIPVMVFVELIK